MLMRGKSRNLAEKALRDRQVLFDAIGPFQKKKLR
jgi:hypothetical protein